MAQPRKLPDTHVLVTLAEKGLSNREIGELFGTTRQAVELRLQGLDVKRPPRVTCSACKGLGTVAPLYAGDSATRDLAPQ
ncbi:hypothetical protein Psed_7014 (plasmid) [Pseudonocardia dioxanivorans CB1190]|uniref:Uncharacterized protein n=1 Tax=Pseudonocardia dioxanivorans (strain ATCC 55486 / DSM 44775 / JCM 13855 / CB1190) TaxID=675635 RepID=F2L798_PSEUX|nr:hypothetical protein Psed_7014 [Pseudonocardia dioxanivorans CB1190]